jgi:hypothetical protein
MSIMRASGRQPGSLPLLLLFLSLWINGCQTPEPPSSGKIGSDTTWTITAQAGPVSLRSPHQSFWHRATPGTRIPPGSQVVTVDGSRLEMASAGDKLTTSGPSRFTLPEAEDNGVRVRQDTGSLRYEVQSAPKRRFEVKTPHFSTVVKGTIFLISIDRASSEVFVDEGRVLILDAKGEPLTELTAGQIGRMAAQPGSTLEVGTGPEPSFERHQSMERLGSGAGVQPSGNGNSTFLETTGVTRASVGAPINKASEPTGNLSLLERIGSAVGDLAGQVRSGDAPTGPGNHLNNDRNSGGGTREQESRDQASRQVDDSRANENGKGNWDNGIGRDNGHGKGNGHGQGRSHGKGRNNGEGKGHGKGRDNGQGNGHGKGNGYGKDKDHGKDKGHDKDKGHGQGRNNRGEKNHGKGSDNGRGHGHGRDKDVGDRGAYIILERDHPVAWNERR